ncbi:MULTISPECIES: 50S ribosomal protein L3 N(5)-glutamine methyltransferase [Herbaspirillum]|jgi:ribosomal protein L3 glutamine methyltransferase|uniref:Ribosomal protein uL3 glutamine methyltransferase n=1 Tax=Herbaspirillum aquaticum TaxID=568783 RepID=A0A225SYD5_9BURK|nr:MULTISPECIES: 50S ribosomal protein L3 N(5)-glutamine methyltransferase [Herbaspirillum]MBN9356647.1 50S ribosomal protein L3 N(5)-glutamine methyltransferase [Herbaspirillum huttiense]MBW9333311.1 50S ribosomal protein L3 N(5)-glutamine methyltransferase [Herbaspirillum sp. RU 5E]MRT29080.1 50S ribosomal protein L3 N(5)-glutamine methyltransferase [Herbaspirillum sp. CAH-3]OWY36299.1 50S ribosomal protein L3 N(5)-glutamine methyltransferase [Herbaspirillum aquaticum]
MTPNNFSTVRDLLRYAVTRFNTEQLFFGHGSSNALDEAAYLILHTLKLPLDQLDPFLDARLLPEEIASVMRVIERRSKDRVPAAYITNEAWLGAYRFYVDERVIVPRSFIAELIPQHFSPWIQDPEAIVNALDLCTGSGCLPILLADAFPNAQIDAVDISADALAVARKNVDDYQLQERINLVESDLYTQLPLRKYDLIISNPPYVNSGSMSKLPQEYLREPQLALAGGEDGMDLVRKIVAGAAERLTPEGVLVVEIGNERAFAEAAFPELELTWLTTSAGDDMVFLVTAEQLQLA